MDSSTTDPTDDGIDEVDDDFDAGGADDDDVSVAEPDEHTGDSDDEPAATRSRAEELFGVGAFIRHQREMAKLSVRRLAELADVSNPYLSQVERGLRNPSAEILQQVAEALKISVETLYIKAGILPDQDRRVSTVPEAVQADAHLTDDQKRALLNVYESFRSS